MAARRRRFNVAGRRPGHTAPPVIRRSGQRRRLALVIGTKEDARPRRLASPHRPERAPVERRPRCPLVAHWRSDSTTPHHGRSSSKSASPSMGSPKETPRQTAGRSGVLQGRRERKTSRVRSRSIDGQVRELVGLFAGIVKGLKRGREEEKPEELQRAFDQGSLGERHFPPLIVLSLEGPLSVSELADRVDLTVATTSLLVGELSRAGLVERSEDEQDRRRTIVSLSDGIRKVADARLREHLQPFRRTLERLSTAERAHFMEGVRVLNQETGGFGAGSNPADC
jgi:DNA-binding MarR family transcriptional regulator